MREYVTCSAPPGGIDEDDPDFNQFCREQCSTRRVARWCDLVQTVYVVNIPVAQQLLMR
jgi:hypothetical protein